MGGHKPPLEPPTSHHLSAQTPKNNPDMYIYIPLSGTSRLLFGCCDRFTPVSQQVAGCLLVWVVECVGVCGVWGGWWVVGCVCVVCVVCGPQTAGAMAAPAPRPCFWGTAASRPTGGGYHGLATGLGSVLSPRCCPRRALWWPRCLSRQWLV